MRPRSQLLFLPRSSGACPIGSLQSFLSGLRVRVPYYVVGLLLFLAAVLGRAVCGFLCPFGLIQELLHFIPGIPKRNRFRADRPMRKIKYAVLVLLVIVLPLLYPLTPFFCKYLCPLGAIYGLFNKLSLYRMDLDTAKCVRCGKCAAACRMCIDPSLAPNSAECIRCGDCTRACPTKALHLGFRHPK